MKEAEVDFSAREMTEDITYSDLDEEAAIGNVRSQFFRANRRRRSSYTSGERDMDMLDPNEESIACQGLVNTARLSSSLPEVPASTDALTCPIATSFHQTCSNDRTGPPNPTSCSNFSVSSLASSDVGGSSVYGTARKKPTPVGLQTFFPTTSVDALYPDETIHQLNFKERLASEVAHFQLCEHVIGELEAVHFSCLLPESWRRVEKILVDAEDFQPFESPPPHRQQARRSRSRLSNLRSRSLSGELCVSAHAPGSSLSPPSQRSRCLSLDSHIPQSAAATVDDLSSSPSVGTLLPHSLTGPSLVPSQAAQAASGLLRCCLDRQQRQQPTPSRPGLADTLRFRRLQEICASLSDLDWVDAQAAATLRLLAFTGQLGPALISNSNSRGEDEVPSSGSGEGELLDFDDRLTDSYYTCVSGATGRACGSHYPAPLHSRKPSLSTAFWSLSDYQSIYSPASPSEGRRSLSRPTSHPRQLQTPMPSVAPDLTLSSEPLRYPPSLQSEVGASWSIGVENYFRNVSTAAHHRPSFSRFTSSLVSTGHQLITSAPVPKSKRQSILAGQRNHCAGCGVHVETKYLRSMRFCEYFGRFFCCTCHTNTLMVVPGAVLYHWTFLMLPVSNFARDILCRLHSRPVIHLADFQPNILKREHVLRDAIELRRQASRMVPFLRLCREGSSSVSAVERLPPHWYASADNWSLADLCAVAQGSLSSRLRRALEPCVEHLSTCLRCKARGFLCEVCHTGRVLFPFGQVNTVVCVDCGACFHRTCLSRPPSADSCPRCLRRRQRAAVAAAAAAAASLQRRSGGEEEEVVVEGVIRKSPIMTDADTKLAVNRTADDQFPILLNTLSSSATSAVSATPAGKELTAS